LWIRASSLWRRSFWRRKSCTRSILSVSRRLQILSFLFFFFSFFFVCLSDACGQFLRF
jgi:hypothetical protein